VVRVSGLFDEKGCVVLAYDQIRHFRAFGFVVLRGFLGALEVAGLTSEVTTELAEAFGGIGVDSDGSGIPGDYLPLMVDRAPLSQGLVADDPRLFQGAAELLGGPVVPTPAVATCFTGNAGWHTDIGPDVRGVKFLAYLEPRAAQDGALRVIPGSHDPGFADRLRSYWGADPAGQGFAGWPVPCVVTETVPGDVIAFDSHLFHASVGGDRRLAWSIEYLAWPGLADGESLRVTRDLVVDAGEFAQSYSRERWPVWREWVAGAASPSRLVAVERLRLLGALGPGASASS
jgi:hypothetical protein